MKQQHAMIQWVNHFCSSLLVEYFAQLNQTESNSLRSLRRNINIRSSITDVSIIIEITNTFRDDKIWQKDCI